MEGYDVQDVINAECTLEPIVCRFCGSEEVTFNQGIGDGYCATCGQWQGDESKCPMSEKWMDKESDGCKDCEVMEENGKN